jgi:hypothetical protein
MCVVGEMTVKIISHLFIVRVVGSKPPVRQTAGQQVRPSRSQKQKLAAKLSKGNPVKGQAGGSRPRH